MTGVMHTIPVEPPVLFRVSGELCLRPGVRRHNSLGKASDRALDLPETLSVPSRSWLQPRATLSVTGKNPFNPQYA